MNELIERLKKVDDARQTAKSLYPLVNILFITICSVFFGAETWEDICLFAKYKEKWLNNYIDMSCGVPSLWTFRRVLGMMSPSGMGEITMGIIQLLTQKDKNFDHIAIDGKCLRGNKSPVKDIRPLQIVSAWCEDAELSLAEVAVDKKSNEITAIPKIIRLINIIGATITIDAMGTQNNIAQDIIDQGGDYVLALKGNKGKLHTEVKNHMENSGTALENLVKDYFDHSHGRSVRRRYFTCEVPQNVKEFAFPGLKTLIATETISSKVHETKVTAEWRYYLSSHDASNKKIPNYIRGHWGVENKLHWILDVHLGDDADRKLDRIAAENLSRIKRFLVNLIRAQDPNKKMSIGRKLKRLQWDNDYLTKVLLA